MDHRPRRFGAYEVSVLRDGFFEAPSDVLIHTAGEAARRDMLLRWGRPKIGVDVNCFLLRGPDGLSLVDAGTGTSWGEAFGHAPAALQAIGVTPDQIQSVLLTHLHGDHALGLFEGDSAVFPGARICVPRTELDFFTDPDARAAVPEERRSGFDIAARLQRLYDDRVVGIEGEAMEGIEAVAMPGHTPGHTGYLVKDAGRNLVLWGDLLHVAELQPSDPDIGIVYDLDPDTAARSRRTVLEQAAAGDWIVAGGHVAGFVQVRRASQGYELIPA